MKSPPRRRHSRRVRSDSAESLAKEALSPQLRISGQYLGVSLSEFQASRIIDSVPHHSEQDELFMTATSVESLKKSWRVVLARDARDGELRHQTEHIAGHLDEVLAELSRSLRDGTFRPAPLAQVRLPKKEEGDYRTLDIPSVRDRIVERALVDALGHRVDQAMSPCSYGYRLGLGVDDAIDHLTGLRDLGMVHVLRTDVEDFFPHVRLDSVLNTLGNLLPSRRLLALVALLVVPRRTWRASTIRPGGVAQGSALSPMLANLAFTAVDEAMTRTGIGYVRFADDIVVCADTRARLLEARDLLTSPRQPTASHSTRTRPCSQDSTRASATWGRTSGPSTRCTTPTTTSTTTPIPIGSSTSAATGPG